ncbi:CLUMA_CG017486, isoform A [Clunio marinus]|uniref:CLUMA_CG017486, isoform A n=1 Tax=Clunio marinus TaxID=568069 RepID=A0A1J1IWB8_9DIPT|nr:CLUMA_CG017486, isoform A [Clunio marinus]
MRTTRNCSFHVNCFRCITTDDDNNKNSMLNFKSTKATFGSAHAVFLDVHKEKFSVKRKIMLRLFRVWVKMNKHLTMNVSCQEMAHKQRRRRNEAQERNDFVDSSMLNVDVNEFQVENLDEIRAELFFRPKSSYVHKCHFLPKGLEFRNF